MSVTGEGLALTARLIATVCYEIVAFAAEGDELARVSADAIPASGAVRFSAQMVGVSRPITRFEVQSVADSEGVVLGSSGSVTFAEFAILAPEVGPDNTFQVVYTLPLGGK